MKFIHFLQMNATLLANINLVRYIIDMALTLFVLSFLCYHLENMNIWYVFSQLDEHRTGSCYYDTIHAPGWPI
jgi:hypothetical protein